MPHAIAMFFMAGPTKAQEPQHRNLKRLSAEELLDIAISFKFLLVAAVRRGDQP